MSDDRKNITAPMIEPKEVEDFATLWGVDLQAVRAAPKEDLDEVSARYIAAMKAKDRLARYESNIGTEYRATDWTHPHLAPFMAMSNAVMSWRPAPGKKGLLITGPSGRGKTRALSALYYNLAITEGLDVRYYSAADWFSMLGENVRYGVDEARHFVNRHAAYPVFIMDDMGQQARVSPGKDDWAQAWFFRFLDLRRANALPFIMTTNLTATEIAVSSGDAKGIRSDPLLVRLLDLCDIVTYETPEEAEAKRVKRR